MVQIPTFRSSPSIRHPWYLRHVDDHKRPSVCDGPVEETRVGPRLWSYVPVFSVPGRESHEGGSPSDARLPVSGESWTTLSRHRPRITTTHLWSFSQFFPKHLLHCIQLTVFFSNFTVPSSFHPVRPVPRRPQFRLCGPR